MPKIKSVTDDDAKVCLGFNSITSSQSFTFLEDNAEYKSIKSFIHNRLERNFHLANKKALLMNLKEYYTALNLNPWDVIPLTFHIQSGITDPEY